MNLYYDRIKYGKLIDARYEVWLKKPSMWHSQSRRTPFCVSRDSGLTAFYAMVVAQEAAKLGMVKELYWDPSDPECIRDAHEFLMQGKWWFHREYNALCIYNRLPREPEPGTVPELPADWLYITSGQYVTFDGEMFHRGRNTKD